MGQLTKTTKTVWLGRCQKLRVNNEWYLLQIQLQRICSGSGYRMKYWFSFVSALPPGSYISSSCMEKHQNNNSVTRMAMFLRL